MVHLTKTFNFVNYKRLILYSWYAKRLNINYSDFIIWQTLRWMKMNEML